MKAAVIFSFETPPRYADFEAPQPRDGHRVVDMLAAAVHQLVRAIAAGRHYGSPDALPVVAGVDGVARLDDGSRAYVSGAPSPFGTLAEQALVADDRLARVPDTLDSVVAAAIVNPAVSSWIPLRHTLGLKPGQTVLVLGATGVSGKIAVALALHLGAGRVIAAGRNNDARARIAADGAHATVPLGDDRDAMIDAIRAAAPDGIDIVLDYVWGTPAEAALTAVRRRGLSHFAAPTQFVQIGSMAGGRIGLDAQLLRSSNVVLRGSGIGSVDPAVYWRAIPEVLELAVRNIITVDVTARPLADVAAHWDDPGRLVYTP